MGSRPTAGGLLRISLAPGSVFLINDKLCEDVSGILAEFS